MSEALIRLRKIAATNSQNLSFEQELKSSYSNGIFLLHNNIIRKKIKKLTVKNLSLFVLYQNLINSIRFNSF